jgi:hypothetical protein
MLTYCYAGGRDVHVDHSPFHLAATARVPRMVLLHSGMREPETHTPSHAHFAV